MNRYSISTPLDRWGRLEGGPYQKPLYLGFSVGPYRLGIPLLRFAEVRDLSAIAPIMRPADYRYGHAVAYGREVSLLDLRVEFQCQAPFNSDTRVLFAWRRIDTTTEAQVGLIVDAVDTVLSVEEADLESPLPSENTPSASHVLGVAVEGEHRRVIVDLDHWIVR